MAKELTLTRADHIALRKKEATGFGMNEKQIERMLAYGLIYSVAKATNVCEYHVSIAGKKYLEDHPALPQLTLTQPQALAIFKLLGDEEYACLNPFQVNGAAGDSLISIQAIKEIKSATGGRTGTYELTEDGKAGFERSAVGQAYLARRKQIEKRNELVAAFSGDYVPYSSWLAEVSKYLLANGDEEGAVIYAAKSKAQRGEEMIYDAVGVLPDGFSVKIENDKDGFLKIVNIICPKGTVDSWHNPHVERNVRWDGNLKRWTWSPYFSFDSINSNHTPKQAAVRLKNNTVIGEVLVQVYTALENKVDPNKLDDLEPGSIVSSVKIDDESDDDSEE